MKLVEQLSQLTRIGETTPARHRAAIVLMMIGGFAASFGGLFVHSLEYADGFQFNTYRGLVGGLVLLIALLARYRRKSLQTFRRLAVSTWLGAVCLGLAAAAYILSLERTTVANTHFVLSAAPFLSAALAWVVLRERVRKSTILAMLVALAGVGMMVREGLALGNVSGDLLALTNVALFAAYSVIMRRNRANDMLPAVVIASFVTMAAGLIGSAAELSMSANDLWLAITWGVIIGLCGDWIFVVAVRHLSAAETTLLLMMIPSLLGPTWVWWLLDEVPSRTTLLGGALVLAAVAGWAVRELWPTSSR